MAEAPFDDDPDVVGKLTSGGLYVLRGPRPVGKSVQIKRTSKVCSTPRWNHDASCTFPWTVGERGTSVSSSTPRDNDARCRQDTMVFTGSSASNWSASLKDLADRRGDATDPDRVLPPMVFRTFAGLLVEDPLPDGVERLRIADLTLNRLQEATSALVP